MRSLMYCEKLAGVLVTVLVAAACGNQVPGTFRLIPQQEALETGFEVVHEIVKRENAPIDILWVIDNSASMRQSQETLRDGLKKFAETYFKSESDIRIAVITTDAFIANERWKGYLDTKLAGRGESPREMMPFWDSQYGRLVEGRHDGNPLGDPKKGVGPTLSGHAILSTQAAFSSGSLSELIKDFEINVAVGTGGLYEEHGFDSLLELIADNERAADSKSQFFRKDSHRIIVFMSDEDDQSLEPSKLDEVPQESLKLLFNGSYYTGRKPELADKYLPSHFTINCPKQMLDGEELAPMSLCIRSDWGKDGDTGDSKLLIKVEDFKKQLDGFFLTLDGQGESGNPNYMIVSIVGMKLETIKNLRNQVPNEITHEPGKRYLKLVDLVKGDPATNKCPSKNASSSGPISACSFAMDIGSTDYSPILERIGTEIERRSVITKFEPVTEYPLERVPSKDRKDITVILERADGSQETLKDSQFSIRENILVLTDKELIGTLKTGDRLVVRYTPGKAIPESQFKKRRSQ